MLFTGDENTPRMGELEPAVVLERVLIRIGTFKAKTSDQMFRGRALSWEQFIPADGRICQGSQSGLSSALDSGPLGRSLIKKVVVSRLGEECIPKLRFDEIGEKYQIQFAIMSNAVAPAFVPIPRAPACTARLPRQQQTQRCSVRRWQLRLSWRVAGATRSRPVLRLGYDRDEAAGDRAAPCPRSLRRLTRKVELPTSRRQQQARESALDSAQPDAKFDIVGK